MEIADADKRAEWCYQACCEVWEIQGHIKSRPLFRAILDFCLQPIFAARESSFQGSFELHQRRTRGSIPQGSAAIVGHLKREMGRLRAKWSTKLEIAARDAENQQRLARERELEPRTQTIQEALLRSVALKQFADSNDRQKLAKFVCDADSLLRSVSLGAKNARQTIEAYGPQAAPSQSLSSSNSTSKPKATRKVKPPSRSEMKRRAVIFGAIQAGLKGEKYCSALDGRRVQLPGNWIEDGCPDTYTQAYKDKRWRQRIHDEKSRYRERYGDTPPGELEAIIQGEMGTRHTRHTRQ
jgi:hypothetical protein